MFLNLYRFIWGNYFRSYFRSLLLFFMEMEIELYLYLFWKIDFIYRYVLLILIRGKKFKLRFFWVGRL